MTSLQQEYKNMHQQQKHLVENIPSRKRNPMVVVLMTIGFAFPFCTGNAQLHYLFFTCYFLFFTVYVFFHTRHYRFSLLGQLRRHHPVLYYLLLAFGLSSLVSYLPILLGDVDDVHKAIATGRYLMYVITLGYVFSLSRFCLVNEISHSQLFFFYMLGTMVLILLLLLIYHFGGAPNAENWAKFPPLGGHARYMGMTAAVAVIVCVVLFLFKENTFHRQLLLWVCMLAGSAFLIWTGSRTSMFLAVLTIFIFMLLGRIYLKTGYTKIVLVTACILLSVLVAEKVSIFPWSGLERSIKVSVVGDGGLSADETTAYALTDKISSGRVFIWSTVVTAAMTSPWFGLGPNAALFVFNVFKPPLNYDQPHNFVLQFLLEWGFIGAGLLLAILAILSWHGLKNIPQAVRHGDTDYLISAGIIFLLTLNGLTDGTYYHVQPVFCLATAFAVFPFFSKAGKAHFMENVTRK